MDNWIVGLLTILYPCKFYCGCPINTGIVIATPQFAGGDNLLNIGKGILKQQITSVATLLRNDGGNVIASGTKWSEAICPPKIKSCINNRLLHPDKSGFAMTFVLFAIR